MFCSYCNKTLSLCNIYVFKRHLNTVHLNEFQDDMEKLQEEIDRQQSLFKCDNCKKEYSSKANLESHKLKKHSKIKKISNTVNLKTVNTNNPNTINNNSNTINYNAPININIQLRNFDEENMEAIYEILRP